MTMMRCCLLCGLLVFLSARTYATCPRPLPLARAEWAGQGQWQAIEQAGMRFGEIDVQVENVYNLERPGENVWYARTADALHLATRPWAIRQLLLIAPGEPATASGVYQATRRLRQQVYLRAAEIVPLSCQDGKVRTLVRASDAWTLRFNVRFAHAGNASQFRFNIEDTDFLGSGRHLGFGHQKTLERSEDYIQFGSPSLLGSRWELDTQYTRLSDGRRAELNLARPFLRDDTAWASRLSVLDQHLDLNFYNHGYRAWKLPATERRVGWQWLHKLNSSGGTILRGGFAARYARYTYRSPIPVRPELLAAPVPEPRTLAGIGPTFNLHQDRYASFTNVRSVARIEDYNMGWDVSGSLWLDSTALGASQSGPAISLTASKGIQMKHDWLLLSDATLEGRYRSGEWRNGDVRVASTLYGAIARRHTLVAHADFAWLNHPDPENRIYVGGFQALRGYPNFYATGSRRLRMTVADRIVTTKVLFNTFQLGYVAFVDAARIDGSQGGDWQPWYADAGAGLRLGNLRGSYDRVLYLTLSKPLRHSPGVSRGLQLVVGNVIDF